MSNMLRIHQLICQVQHFKEFEIDHMITRNYNGAEGSAKQLHYQVEQDGYEGRRETDNKHGSSDPPLTAFLRHTNSFATPTWKK